MRPDLRSDKWNPINELDPTLRTFGDDSAALCAALIKTDSNEHQKHFPDSAREGMTGVTMFVVRDARARGTVPKLADVREIMCLDPKALRVAVEEMMRLGDYDINTRLQKFLAEFERNQRHPLDHRDADRVDDADHARGHGYGGGREVPRHQAAGEHLLRNVTD